jgi:hypothetical protein
MFKKPTYLRHQTATGVVVPGYIFEADVGKITPLTVCYDATDKSQSELTLLQGALRDQSDWWLECVSQFLAVANQHFTKKYAAGALIRHFKHGGLNTAAGQGAVSEASVIIFTPKHVLLSEGQFVMIWTVEKAQIDVPDLEEETVAEPPVQLVHRGVASGLDVSEVDVDSLPVDSSSTDWQGSSVNTIAPNGGAGAPQHQTHSRQYDKRKVREARLKAKLAQYKAEKAISRYLEKYGGDISDSDASEWVSEEDSSESDRG